MGAHCSRVARRGVAIGVVSNASTSPRAGAETTPSTKTQRRGGHDPAAARDAISTSLRAHDGADRAPLAPLRECHHVDARTQRVAEANDVAAGIEAVQITLHDAATG